MSRDALQFPSAARAQLELYLPLITPALNATLPFTTLTYASSIDSSISLAPGTQTALSGPESKAMTHYLRSRHDAILIGVGTAVADDPSLNCRLEGVGGYGGKGLSRQPRPVIVDPACKWEAEGTKVLQLARVGRGRAPWIICAREPEKGVRERLERDGGAYIVVPQCASGEGQTGAQIKWWDILGALKGRGIHSVMVEGGAKVINGLLSPTDGLNFVDSVIVTIAPVWLGQGGVVVCPERRLDNGQAVPGPRLSEVKWVPLGEDVILCGRL